jgi:hypothetical protein
MSFEAAWGFDPDRAMQAKGLRPSEIETDKFTYCAEERRAARIPSDVHSQVMSSAECIDCDAVGREFPHVSPPMYSPGRPFQ